MNSRHKLVENRDYSNADALVKQLEREIECLQRQLERLRHLDGHLDARTANTYKEMIASRKDMLTELNY